MNHRNSDADTPRLVDSTPTTGRFSLSQEIDPRWLALVGAVGASLVVLGLLLDLVWGVDNILPNASLSLGVGTMLFALLFLAERRIVRRTSVVWISAFEELAAQIGQDPAELEAHLSGPVAVVQAFVSAIVNDRDYARAWMLADDNWRLCRAQAWIWNNRDHPLVVPHDLNEAAEGLAQINSSHKLWSSFAETEVQQLGEGWADPDLSGYGAASATRRVDDGEIVLLVDLAEHPHGAVALGPTPVVGVSFLVRNMNGTWLLANLVGDSLPVPGWPPNWNEGWRYWERVFEEHGLDT